MTEPTKRPRMEDALWNAGFSLGEIDDINRALNSHEALLKTLRSTRLYIAQAQDAFNVSDDGMLAEIDGVIAQASPVPSK